MSKTPHTRQSLTRDALSLGASLLAGMVVGHIAARLITPPEPLVRCAGCGVLGEWATENHVVPVVADGEEVESWCPVNPTGRKHRAHGPWIPDPDATRP